MAATPITHNLNSVKQKFTDFNLTEDKNILIEIYEEYNGDLEILSIEELTILASNDFNVSDVLFEKAKENDYKVSDELLAALAKEGDVEARDILAVKYINFVEKVVRQLVGQGKYCKGSDTEDLVQSGYIGFFQAIKDFKIEMGKPFKMFVKWVVNRHINSLITESNSGKNIALNESFSFNVSVGEGSDTTFEHLLSSDDYLPENHILKKETLYEIWDLLSDWEKKVLIYYSESYSYKEIGKIVFGKTHPTERQQLKAVDNTMQRINKKKKSLY